MKIHLLLDVCCNSIHEEVLVHVYSKLRRITCKLGGFCVAINTVQTASQLAVTPYRCIGATIALETLLNFSQQYE